MWRIRVRPEDAQGRVDRFLRGALPGITHAHLCKVLRRGGIRLERLDGSVAKPRIQDRTRDGDVFLVPQLISAQFKGQGDKDRIRMGSLVRKSCVYEDEDIFCMNKPAGLAVQPGTGVTSALTSMIPGAWRTVHRLDKETSGVLVIAKTNKAAAALSDMFSSNQVHKEYVAAVRGIPRAKKGVMDDKIRGQTAVTRFETLKENSKAGFALLKLCPTTGRKHQIRIHCRYTLGCGIVGDTRYGGQHLFYKSLLLHAHQLEFSHPITGASMHVQAPLPPSMMKRLQQLQLPFEIDDKKECEAPST